MPIRFRCPGCEGLLSIATRKAGNEIMCPKCGEALIVPPPLDAAEEIDVEPVPEPEPVAVGGNADVPQKERKRKSRSHDTETLPPDMFDPKPGIPESKKEGKKPKLSDPPLFERSDFEQLLKSPQERKTPGEPPEPAKPGEGKPDNNTKPVRPPGATTMETPALRLGLPVAEDGIYLTRGTAIMLGVLLLVLLGMSFAIGFLVGSH